MSTRPRMLAEGGLAPCTKDRWGSFGAVPEVEPGAPCFREPARPGAKLIEAGVMALGLNGRSCRRGRH